MFNKGKREQARVEGIGKRAWATVLEMSGQRWSLDLQREDHKEFEVRVATLQVEPEGGPAYEVTRKMLLGLYGTYVPKVGQRFEVMYDPDDPQIVVQAPPTAEQEQIRAAAALSKAKIGFSMGGGGGKVASPQPVTDEVMDQHQQSMDQAEAMLQQAQQFMGGGGTPGSSADADEAEDREEKNQA